MHDMFTMEIKLLFQTKAKLLISNKNLNYENAGLCNIFKIK